MRQIVSPESSRDTPQKHPGPNEINDIPAMTGYLRKIADLNDEKNDLASFLLQGL
jgi:hypothetical protein